MWQTPSGQNLPPPTPGHGLVPSSSFQFFKVPPTREHSGDSVSTMASITSITDEDERFGDGASLIMSKIDASGSGSISELELISAVRKYPEVSAYVLPGFDSKQLRTDETVFDAIDEVFEKVSGGKQRVTSADFASYFRRNAAEKTINLAELQHVYSLIDSDRDGTVSKYKLFGSVERSPEVARWLLPSADLCGGAANNEAAFDAVKRVFDTVSGGKKRFDFADFVRHFRKVVSHFEMSLSPQFTVTDRGSRRVLIIGPGFGRVLNPRQGAMVEQAGYLAVHLCEGLPNPEELNFDVRPHLDTVRRAIEHFKPHVVACASKGGAYMVGLWASGCWRGPTVLINAHPCCARLPEGVPVVICQGSNDEVYPTPRARLEELLNTGSANRSFLYYTANSGLLPGGQLSRMGDRHNMDSLLIHDCLPRLLDAVMSREGPESHFIRTWRDRLTDERLRAERCLGYSPDLLRKRWCSPNHRGLDKRKLFEVPFGSEEFNHVAAVFKAQPREPPAYLLSPPATWEVVRIKKVERIENGTVLDGCTKPYYTSIEASINDQGLKFEPGVHTSWAFHGADANAIESIIHNPVCGFQPLSSGTRGSALWGSGTYFARDAKYVADGGFCGQPAPDGTRTMLMSLLVTGMPCLGDPQHRGVLPYRMKPHRYHSSVDHLSSPEVFIVQHSGAAHAAYLISFA